MSNVVKSTAGGWTEIARTGALLRARSAALSALATSASERSAGLAETPAESGTAVRDIVRMRAKGCAHHVAAPLK
eukprot:6184695-Pleurochrysis_carterae.AAC.1